MSPWNMNKALLIKQARERNAIAYLNQLGINGRVAYEIKGAILIFRYNLQTVKGIKTIERRVNLDNFTFKDKTLKSSKPTGIMLNVCTGRFVYC